MTQLEAKPGRRQAAPPLEGSFLGVQRALTDVMEPIFDKVNRSIVEAQWTPRNWTSRIVETDTLSLEVSHQEWRKIKQSNRPLLPGVLADFFPLYGSFHPLHHNHTDQEKPYVFSKNGIEKHKGPLVVAIIAPSTSGKDTLLSHLPRQVKSESARPTTDTTRQRRTGEQRTAYNFRTKNTIKQLEKQNQLVEAIKQGGNLYGTEIYEMGRAFNRRRPIVLWRGDIFGVKRMKAYCDAVGIPFVSVGVLPGLSHTDMKGRIVKKRGKAKEQQWRWRKAKYEIEHLPDVADYLFVNHPKIDAEGNPDARTSARHLGWLLLSLVGKEATLQEQPRFSRLKIIFQR